ncbi:MAG TPA: type IV pilus modification protein PilV [Rhodanobacteraceae bacterium]|nr:type IV pilus modification protein PilV [Rhodanobacteraceae bacterium]
MTIRRAQRGFSMLEVLIAVLVFSLGIIGLAGLLIFAIQSNHVAYLRTQATFLAHTMADRMAANPAGLWEGAYNADYPVPASTADCAAGCGPAELAVHDQQQWSTQLQTFLPNVSGKIDCETNGIAYKPPAIYISQRPPYGGTCTMQLDWNEAHSATGKQQLHTFEWKFQP